MKKLPGVNSKKVEVGQEGERMGVGQREIPLRCFVCGVAVSKTSKSKEDEGIRLHTMTEARCL